MSWKSPRLRHEIRESGYVTLGEISESWGLGRKAADNMRCSGNLLGCVKFNGDGPWVVPIGTKRPEHKKRKGGKGRYSYVSEQQRVVEVPILGKWAMWPVPVVAPLARSFGWFGAVVTQ